MLEPMENLNPKRKKKDFCCSGKTSSIPGGEILARYNGRDEAQKGLGEDVGQP